MIDIVQKIMGFAAVKAARATGSATQYEHFAAKAYLEAWGGKRAEAEDGESEGGIVTTTEPDGALGVYLSGLVGGDFLATEYAALLAEEPERPVVLYINSPGGVANEGIQIGQITARHKGGVKAVVDGLAGSAATIPAIRAESLEFGQGAEWLVHEAAASFMCATVTAGELRDKVIPGLEATNQSMGELYAKATGQDYDAMRSLMAQDRIMTASEAVDMGFGRLAEGGAEQTALDLADLPERIRPLQGETPDRVKAMARYLAATTKQGGV